MIFSLAWKNIWRKPSRSIIVISAITVGIWVGLFLHAFDSGMLVQRIDNVIGEESAHIQIHHPAFLAEKDKEFLITGEKELISKIKTKEHVEAVSSRTFLKQSIINSPYGNPFVSIQGIDVAGEDSLTHFSEFVKDGKYFNQDKRKTPPILIGRRLAEKIKKKVKSKVVITHQTASGETKRSLFKVIGIVELTNKFREENTVFLRNEDLQRTSDIKGVHEIVIRLDDNLNLQKSISIITPIAESYDVQAWDDILPEFKMALEMNSSVMGIMIAIILIAVGFGIVNTMLMAVLERTREIGMLMAVGMNIRKIFQMVMLETIMLTMFGAPIGLFLGWITILYLGNVGIDLTAFATSIEGFGYDAMVYPSAGIDFYITTFIQVTVLAILASFYPAIKALKLKPVTALKKI